MCSAAASCVTHDAYEYLPQIGCPTMVLGGTDDRIVTGRASEEMAEKIPGCRLKMSWIRCMSNFSVRSKL